jgi:spectinomycin phosphotransferase
MKTETRDIDKQQLMQAINAAYGLDITSLTFVPKGEDAHIYISGQPDGACHFVRAQAAARAVALEPVYGITHTLRTQYGLAAIVAPCANCSGRFTLDFAGYIVAVFRYIEGRSLYDQGVSATDLKQAATIIAALHESSAAHDIPALQKEIFGNPFKPPILRALRAAQQAGDGAASQANRVRRQAQKLLMTERASVLATLEKMEWLGVRAQELATDWVLTHGDPNLDNLLKDAQGRLHLTDWDAIALGPPERDLFTFTGEGFEPFLGAYARARTKVALHQDLFAFYFYRWTMQEIADYTTRILFGNLGPAEDEHAWLELQPYLPIQHEAIAHGVQAVQAVLDRVLG